MKSKSSLRKMRKRDLSSNSCSSDEEKHDFEASIYIVPDNVPPISPSIRKIRKDTIKH